MVWSGLVCDGLLRFGVVCCCNVVAAAGGSFVGTVALPAQQLSRGPTRGTVGARAAGDGAAEPWTERLIFW